MHSQTLLHCFLFLASLCFSTESVIAQSFVNISEEQGVDLQVQSDGFGNGISTYDFDNDGWDDVTFAVHEDSLAFYRNDNGQLVKMPSFLYAPGETKHVLWVDYDNDGDLDLTVTTWIGTYRLYNNDGQFHFTDVSLQAGLAQFIQNTYGVAWGDYDRDGDLDLYVCLYEYEGTSADFARMNHLYRNNGNGTFTDVTMAAGVSDGIQMSFQAVWFDYDKDGWPDLYILNDRWFSNSMYHNNGNGTFTEVGGSTNTRASAENCMTASVGDFDNDEDLDIYITNTGLFGQEGMLFRNNDPVPFDQIGAAFGVNIASWSWGATWVDADNDTWQDLYVTTGVASGPVEDNVFYHNLGGEGFESMPSALIGDNNATSFAVGRFDLDNDGNYDLAVQNKAPKPPFIWHNQGTDNHFIKITLRGTASNRFAIGSWIRVYAGGHTYTQYTLCGENYISQNSQHHIFGLGAITTVDSIQVEYVRGHIDTYYDLEVDQRYYFTEGETYFASIGASGPTAFCQGGSVVLDAGEHVSYAWNSGQTGRYITVNSSGSYWALVTGPGGVQVSTDTMNVTLYPTPVLSSVTQNPTCAGDASGMITVTNTTGVAPQSVSWTNGGTGLVQNDLPAGTYGFIYTDVHGCVAGGSAQLVAPPELFVQTTTTGALGTNTGSLETLVFGGVPPYTITLDGAMIGTSTTGLAAGEYDLLITDAYGCEWAEVVTVEQLNSIVQYEALDPQVYPNPTSGLIRIDADQPIRSAWATDLEGRCVVRSVGLPAGTMDLSGIAAGHYIIHATLNDGSVVRSRIMKLGSAQ